MSIQTIASVQSDVGLLAVGHEASRTGAPSIMMAILRWLSQYRGVSPRILLARGGPLVQQFAAIGEAHVLDSEEFSKFSLGRRIASKIGGAPNAFVERCFSRRVRTLAGRPRLVYANTLASCEVIERLQPIDCPVVWHVHELSFAASQFISSDRRRRIFGSADAIIACAEVVRDNLISQFDIDPQKISVVHEFIKPIDMPCSQDEVIRAKELKRGALCRELGLPSSARFVGMAGQYGWRKGADLFIQLAHRLRRSYGADIHFVWLGDRDGLWPDGQIQHDIESTGLSGRVHFIGSRDDLKSYLPAFDVMALTSREDPFPLVMLEAASAHCPIVAFDGAGGAREFVDARCGVLIPYLDVQFMAAEVASLLNQSGQRWDMGRCGAEKVLQRHTIEQAGPAVWDVIKRFMI